MTLAPVFLGSLVRRRMATLFSLLAIILGVALGMAVQAIHEAALNEFGRGVRVLAGTADLRLVGPASGFDETLLEQILRHPEIAVATPIVEVEAKLASHEQLLRILGVDIFTLARVAPRLLPQSHDKSDRFAPLAEDSIFLSSAAQEAYGVKIGEQLTVQDGSRSLKLRVAGDLPGVVDGQRLAVMDIAAAQLAFGRIGKLSRIDLIVASTSSPESLRDSLQATLPAGVLLETPEAASEQSGNLSRAYRVNLSMLAAIALLTGAFLVFSAQALSVVKRRSEFAFLRALGLERATLIRWLLAEGALIGLLGGIIGVALGYGLAWAALQLLGGDLGAGYFSGLQPQLEFKPALTALYVFLGLLAGLAGAALPALQAADISPAQALKSTGDALLMRSHLRPWAGLLALTLSLAVCFIPPLAGLPLGGYAAIAFLLAGSILLLPAAAHRLTQPLAEHGTSVAWRLAAARLVSAPGYAVVSAAGVLTSVALAVAMAIMVASFRESVDEWLSQLLPADLYLRAGRAQSSAYMGEDLQAAIARTPGIKHLAFTRHDQLRLGEGQAPVALIARPLPADGSVLPLVGKALLSNLPALWISEAMADQFGWQPGRIVSLPLGGVAREFHVNGVWRDYSRQTGALMIDLAVYRQMTGDLRVNDAAITVAEPSTTEQVANRLMALADDATLEVARPGEIRRISLHIFDRTFAVTYLLEAVAIVIGLAGVAASFASLAATRRKEFGMLRHLGVSRAQIGAMLALEGALVASIGVLGGLLAGAGIGLILIEVVNRQSFHWSMDLHVPWGALLLFASSLIALASLAAVMAGRQAMRQDAVLAVREDW
jgi:putative ABC transport system permease protein